ncbi:MAG: aminodeoxychorismate/anthranilate synthase component II [Gammaproteobacteria bacterium]|nr:aminodeoxychorismate/anthranilate synthase component II [Gammaproteobacteria bacterium]
MLLMIDNYDSFTFNLVQYLQELGQEVLVKRNDAMGIDEIRHLAPDRIVISPGPGTPDDAGVSLQLVEALGATTPILGVCLGHQVIAQSCGASIVHARAVMHGKTSEVFHDGAHVFAGLPSPFEATRYHSLVVDAASLPDVLEINAWSYKAGERDEIMGLRHRHKPLYGVQFHPEAIFTEHGHQLLRNFLAAESAPLSQVSAH